MHNETQAEPVCRVCKEPIKRGALKCRNCDSYQDWRRFFGVSSSVLSVLVALFSVLTVLVTTASHVFTKDDSDVRASVFNIRTDSLTFRGKVYPTFVVEIFVTNVGTRPGAIKTVLIKLPGETKLRDMVLIPKSSANLAVSPTTAILESGRSDIMSAHVLLEKEQTFSDFELVVETISFRNVSQGLDLRVNGLVPSYAR